MEQKSMEMARLAIEALEDKKAEDIRVIDIYADRRRAMTPQTGF